MLKKNYKKIFLNSICLAIFSLTIFGFVQIETVTAQGGNLTDADTLLRQAGNGTGIEGGKLGTLPSVLGLAFQLALSLLGTIMFAYMVYAGFLWMTAQGDSEKISSAKGIMLNTIIGFLVVVSAWAITFVVQSRFQ